jgi:hypothetical protein
MVDVHWDTRRRPDPPAAAGAITWIGYGCTVGLHLSQIDEADELLTNDPLALLIGMVLDQRVSEGWSGMGRSVIA